MPLKNNYSVVYKSSSEQVVTVSVTRLRYDGLTSNNSRQLYQSSPLTRITQKQRSNLINGFKNPMHVMLICSNKSGPMALYEKKAITHIIIG